jgi:hypothetical protein
MSKPNPNPPVGNVICVQVVYCVGNSVKRVWVDMEKVGGISWTSGSVPGKPENLKLPTVEDCAEDCKARPPLVKDGICWWNGKDWICGDAE